MYDITKTCLDRDYLFNRSRFSTGGYADTGLTNGTYYCYQVLAYDAQDNESDMSEVTVDSCAITDN
jgi:hypothetical protein